VTTEEQVGATRLAMRGVWWLNPAVAFGVPTIIVGVTAYSLGPGDYLHFWRTAKYFDFSCFDLVGAIVFTFVCGCLFGAATRGGRDSVPTTDWTLAVRWQAVRLLFNLSFLLSVLAYALWFGVGIKNGLNLRIILDIIRGANDANYFLREEYLTTIPGVTTAAQLGITVIVLGVPLGVATGWRTVRWQCATVILLGLIRAFLNSERLAIIELLVPFAVSLIWLQPATSRLLRLLTQSAPIIAGLFLFCFFGAAEYFRSWSDFYARSESSFWGFVAVRLMGYYTAALNNGALLWRVDEPLPLHLPPITLDFVWHFPIIKDLLPVLIPSLRAYAGDVAGTRYLDLLSANANPELTNPSGVFSPLIDYGLTGGLLYWLICGLICGYLYKEFRLRSVVGIFLYPALYISLIEATRVLYWAEGRFFPAMLLLVVGVLFMFREPSRGCTRRALLAARMPS
jgi:hypothetical protein